MKRISLYIELWEITFKNGNLLGKSTPINFEISENADPLELNFIKDSYFAHSTSWRFEEKMGFILTFVKFIPQQILVMSPVDDFLPAAQIDIPVFKHALRHLSFLAHLSEDFQSLFSGEELTKFKSVSPLPAGMFQVP